MAAATTPTCEDESLSSLTSEHCGEEEKKNRTHIGASFWAGGIVEKSFLCCWGKLVEVGSDIFVG